MKSPMNYTPAKALADVILLNLRPECQRIEIAGSLRRLKPVVGDIEILAVPDTTPDLFGVAQFDSSGVDALLRRMAADRGWSILKNGPRFKQVDLGPITLDLFLCSAPEWGSQFIIRTGPADYSHWLVTHRREGGAMPGYLRQKDGRLWTSDGQALNTPEEADYYTALGLPWIEPEKRQAPANFQTKKE